MRSRRPSIVPNSVSKIDRKRSRKVLSGGVDRKTAGRYWIEESRGNSTFADEIVGVVVPDPVNTRRSQR